MAKPRGRAAKNISRTTTATTTATAVSKAATTSAGTTATTAARMAASMAALIVFFSSTNLYADEAITDTALFETGSAALAKGEYGTAISTLETLADRGYQHPDASYNRGVAYLTRIQSRAEKPGDLGRAAAAFEETLRLRPDDAEAERALDLVRAEVTRRRSRKGGDAIDQRPTFDRLVVGLFSETTWTVSSVIASALLALGVLLRRFDRPQKQPANETTSAVALTSTKATLRPAHPAFVAGSVLVILGVALLLLLVPMAWHARTLASTTKPGVIVAAETHLTDENGKALGGDPVPEAAAVEVGERRLGLVQIRWGTISGWAPAEAVRVLP